MGSLSDGKIVGSGSQPVPQSIDVEKLANLVVSALNVKGVAQDDTIIKRDAFDNSASLDKLAEAMVVQRKGNEANFQNLGNVRETKPDGDVKKTIDALSQLE